MFQDLQENEGLGRMFYPVSKTVADANRSLGYVQRSSTRKASSIFSSESFISEHLLMARVLNMRYTIIYARLAIEPDADQLIALLAKFKVKSIFSATNLHHLKIVFHFGIPSNLHIRGLLARTSTK